MIRTICVRRRNVVQNNKFVYNVLYPMEYIQQLSGGDCILKCFNISHNRGSDCIEFAYFYKNNQAGYRIYLNIITI